MMEDSLSVITDIEVIDSTGGRYRKTVQRVCDFASAKVYEVATGRNIDSEIVLSYPWRNTEKCLQKAHEWADKVIAQCEQYETLPKEQNDK